MPLIIGMDEAGYGPNLGPLVVTATVWEVPDTPRRLNLWRAFSSVLTPEPDGADDLRLHVADSKLVYSPARGLGRLERSVQAALRLFSTDSDSFHGLWQLVAASSRNGLEQEPWFHDCDLPLPCSPAEECDDSLETIVAKWRRCCEKRSIRPKVIRSEIVLPQRFNALVRDCDSKGLALSRLSLQLLRSVWNPEEDEPALIIADKHGGRNRYDQLLSEILDGRMVFRREEARERSVYQVGRAEIHFQTRAEQHLPVALASMVSKYLREVSMDLFNKFWRTHLPELRPTAGYPGDSHRFRNDIAGLQARLGISDDILWRER